MPGRYPDPADPQRYWDGRRWTATTAPGTSGWWHIGSVGLVAWGLWWVIAAAVAAVAVDIPAVIDALRPGGADYRSIAPRVAPSTPDPR
jgi:hypothetical protein